jgi:hypothetical protein
MDAETKPHFVEEGADEALRGGVFAADARHVPGAAFFGEAIEQEKKAKG